MTAPIWDPAHVIKLSYSHKTLSLLEKAEHTTLAPFIGQVSESTCALHSWCATSIQHYQIEKNAPVWRYRSHCIDQNNIEAHLLYPPCTPRSLGMRSAINDSTHIEGSKFHSHNKGMKKTTIKTEDRSRCCIVAACRWATQLSLPPDYFYFQTISKLSPSLLTGQGRTVST